ncbi:M48 family metallopeptidase [Candidatus Colwellia aromaticivorans]|uniref:M48 family metallopeptidase n=1 Tax=Candidatus Colwellia aromaticivorans TaxID=2267621 RepID=UPI001FE6E025|nr:SprT family zinc-dependent metalloprotease [Candidatus Colwellia aromaticivorans]
MSDVIEYQVVRSHRKTLSLQVRHGQVFVRAPYSVDEKFISTFIHKKLAWLKSKIAQQNQTNDFCCDFSQGSTLFLFGKLVTLQIIFDKQARTVLTDGIDNKQVLTIVLAERNQKKLSDKGLLATAVKTQIEKYFKQQAEEVIPLKVETYSQLTSLNPSSIKIRKYRARWGSCNNRGELSFNYLLMMLPTYVIDYVIVHELCHLEHLNHSKEFWQLVAKYFPHYVEAKQWIKENQSALLWRLSSD